MMAMEKHLENLSLVVFEGEMQNTLKSDTDFCRWAFFLSG